MPAEEQVNLKRFRFLRKNIVQVSSENHSLSLEICSRRMGKNTHDNTEKSYHEN